MINVDMSISIQEFDYNRAFHRNIGWFTQTEQKILSEKTVAIAGIGGVGGSHLLTLVRLGIQHFRIAEFDHFELGNFNRQAGASMSNVGRPKIDVLLEMARDINPNCKFTIFTEGINKENIDKFLTGVDVYVDGIDFFAIEARKLVFKKCYELAVPAITAAPIGMGTAYLIFMPGRMSFEEYFKLEGKTELAQYARFMVGLAPDAIHRHYLVDATRMDIAAKQGPSTMIACNLCSSVATTEAIKILLKRGKIYPAPYYHVFDAYLNTYKRGYTIGGARNPLFLLKAFIVKRHISKLKQPSAENMSTYTRPIEQILNRSRWAASGENVQNWQFEIIDDYSAKVITSAIAEDVYERNSINNPALIALGMLVETAKIAASGLGLAFTYQCQMIDNNYVITLKSVADNSSKTDELAPYIEARSVNRFPYQARPLSVKEKEQLTAELGDDFTIEWYESWKEKLAIAKLNSAALDIHLRLAEDFHLLEKRLDWKNKFSPDRMPVSTLPINPLTRKIMRFAIKKWSRIDFLNRYMGGTLSPKIEMAFIPAIKSAAHFFIVAKEEKFIKGDIEETIEIGRRLQRFWLAATHLGLVMQPSFASMCFAACGRQKKQFTQDISVIKKAAKLAEKLSFIRANKQISDDYIVFAGRIGTPTSPTIKSRSLRKPLEELIIK